MTGKLLKHLTTVFVNKVPSLKVSRKGNYDTDVGSDKEPILNYINKKNDIPTKILKEDSELLARHFHQNINFCFENSNFRSNLKVANITPAFNKNPETSNDNYRLISILPNISKICERFRYNQI